MSGGGWVTTNWARKTIALWEEGTTEECVPECVSMANQLSAACDLIDKMDGAWVTEILAEIRRMLNAEDHYEDDHPFRLGYLTSLYELCSFINSKDDGQIKRMSRQ